MEEMIRNLGEMAIDEVYGAHNYAKLAYENKKHYPQMAEAVANMAPQELGHAEMLIRSARTMLDSHKDHADYDKVNYLLGYFEEKVMDVSVETKACLEKYKSL